MAKATGTKKHSSEILDDNGTLIATPGAPGAKPRGGNGGAKPDEGQSPGRS